MSVCSHFVKKKKYIKNGLSWVQAFSASQTDGYKRNEFFFIKRFVRSAYKVHDPITKNTREAQASVEIFWNALKLTEN